MMIGAKARILGALIILFFLTGGAPATAFAPTVPIEYFVDDTGSGTACTQASPCTLQYALGDAIAGDNIYLAAGTYTGTGDEIIYLDKSVNLYGGWNGTLAYPPERDPDFLQSILDGQNARRGISIVGNGSDPLSPVISGLYVTNGNASGLTTNCYGASGPAAGCGGGIFIVSASPLVEGNRIFGNKASVSGVPLSSGYGGGIYARWCGGTQIVNNQIYSNLADDTNQGMGGGAILYECQAGTLFEGNHVYDNDSGISPKFTWGAGLALGHGQPAVQYNHISDNGSLGLTDIEGGGIFVWFGHPLIHGNLLVGNHGLNTVYLGWAVGGSSFTGNRVLENNSQSGLTLMYSNRTGFGCGPSEYLYVYNNFIAKSADTGLNVVGTGSNSGVCAKVFHNTLDGDHTGVNLSGDFGLEFSNNIISNQSSIGIDQEEGASMPLLSHNLFYNNFSNGLVGPSDLTTGNPKYKDPVNGNFHIWCDSAAVDAGDGSVVAEIDIDGQIRPLFSGVDIGADECTPFFFLPFIKRP